MPGIYSAVAVKCVHTHWLLLYMAVSIVSSGVHHSCPGLKLCVLAQRIHKGACTLRIIYAHVHKSSNSNPKD